MAYCRNPLLPPREDIVFLAASGAVALMKIIVVHPTSWYL